MGQGEEPVLKRPLLAARQSPASDFLSGYWGKTFRGISQTGILVLLLLLLRRGVAAAAAPGHLADWILRALMKSLNSEP